MNEELEQDIESKLPVLDTRSSVSVSALRKAEKAGIATPEIEKEVSRRTSPSKAVSARAASSMKRPTSPRTASASRNVTTRTMRNTGLVDNDDNVELKVKKSLNSKNVSVRTSGDEELKKSGSPVTDDDVFDPDYVPPDLTFNGKSVPRRSTSPRDEITRSYNTRSTNRASELIRESERPSMSSSLSASRRGRIVAKMPEVHGGADPEEFEVTSMNSLIKKDGIENRLLGFGYTPYEKIAEEGDNGPTVTLLKVWTGRDYAYVDVKNYDGVATSDHLNNVVISEHPVTEIPLEIRTNAVNCAKSASCSVLFECEDGICTLERDAKNQIIERNLVYVSRRRPSDNVIIPGGSPVALPVVTIEEIMNDPDGTRTRIHTAFNQLKNRSFNDSMKKMDETLSEIDRLHKKYEALRETIRVKSVEIAKSSDKIDSLIESYKKKASNIRSTTVTQTNTRSATYLTSRTTRLEGLTSVQHENLLELLRQAKIRSDLEIQILAFAERAGEYREEISKILVKVEGEMDTVLSEVKNLDRIQ